MNLILDTTFTLTINGRMHQSGRQVVGVDRRSLKVELQDMCERARGRGSRGRDDCLDRSEEKQAHKSPKDERQKPGHDGLMHF